jgi:hypothetical protein
MIMSTSISTTAFLTQKHRGPNPGIIAVVYVFLFMLSLIIVGIMTKGAGFPRPFDAWEKSQDVFVRFASVMQLNALLQFGAAIPLGLFTAAVTSRLTFLGINVTGVNIALFGGITSSLLMMFSGMSTWILSQPGVAADLNVLHAVQLFGFITGGSGFVVAFGLLLAGVSVPCLFGKLTPKWLAVYGIVLAAFAELSVFSLIYFPAFFLLPLVRYGSFIWIIGIGFTLIKKWKTA